MGFPAYGTQSATCSKIALRLRVSWIIAKGPQMLRRRPVSTQMSLGRKGSIAVEYILLATIVGIGLIAGLACVRDALVAELRDLALAIRQLL